MSADSAILQCYCTVHLQKTADNVWLVIHYREAQPPHFCCSAAPNYVTFSSPAISHPIPSLLPQSSPLFQIFSYAHLLSLVSCLQDPASSFPIHTEVGRSVFFMSTFFFTATIFRRKLSISIFFKKKFHKIHLTHSLPVNQGADTK